MGFHPINLVFRFILEVCAFISAGLWSFNQTDGLLKFLFGFGFPIFLAIIWGVFTVPNDKSRSGNAPIPTNGIIRLAIELGIFAMATWSLYSLGYNNLYLIFGIAVVIHYVLSYDRISWLISK
ncbi:MAG: YrdB family protein [Polaribacter sp.]|jgi:uncharacterized membrane protein|nr:YrdB family protein [Polaribacter sp.]MDG1955068.1 YrdB family protein [Polaribacter sp.]MDG2074736.1 YrdB family protein [Polaribacter sp.]